MDEYTFIELFVKDSRVYWQNQSRSFCIAESIIQHIHFNIFYIVIHILIKLAEKWKILYYTLW